jgi:monoamine oxidase
VAGITDCSKSRDLVAKVWLASLLWREEGGKARHSPALGGENLSDVWPGCMNGAAQTGRLAAQAVLASQRH